MSKLIKYIIVIVVGVCLFAYKYVSNDNSENIDTYTSIVFKDSKGDLIPVSVLYNSSLDFEMDMRNKLILMQGKDYTNIGLNPILTDLLVLNYAYIENDRLKIDFNKELLNQNPIDVLEVLSFMCKDYKIKGIDLSVDNEIMGYFPNSNIPMSFSSNFIGLNNFINLSHNITESISVTCYKCEVINDYKYYKPYTFRVNENNSIEYNIKDVVEIIDSSIRVDNVDVKEGSANIYLSSNILLDNEQIDSSLEKCIYLSVLSFDEIEDVILYADNEEISRYNHKEIMINVIE